MSLDTSPSLDGSERLPTYAERRTETPLHSDGCGPCADCREFMADCTRPDPLPHLCLDGTWTVPPAPTFAELVHHGERVSVESVYETGEQFLSATEVALLKGELARIAQRKRPRFAPKQKTAAPTSNDARALYESGLAPEEIATRLGWKLVRVRRAIREES